MNITKICILSVLLLSNNCIAGTKELVQEEEKTAALVATDNENLCGYKSCLQAHPDKLNVHLVPHTHDDLGWLKTVDQYYYGSKSKIQLAGVQYILDSVMEALLKDTSRRFSYAETAFFWMWWEEQSASTQELVKNLVNEGRLEFIGGAWSQNDEAVTHYQPIIDQFTWGLRKLNDMFGECGRPRVAWQIDPFGHSRQMASLIAEMGYDAVLFGRLDYQDKAARLKNRTLEFVWEGSPNLGTSSDLFTSILYNVYSQPPDFCFDILCKDTPIIDNKNSMEYNAEEKVEEFIKYVNKQALHYTTNNIILTMGGDFTYQYANMWFKNMDKLIKHVNEADEGINVFYSTPSCYIKAVNDMGYIYKTKQDDFFPYASNSNSYWTGYYTSRPTTKYFERQTNNFLQVAKQVTALTQLGESENSSLERLREAMGIMQHHDAITGTAKQHVTDDYTKMLSSRIQEVQESVTSFLNHIIPIEEADNIEFESCLELNISKCDISEQKDRFVVTVYNPLSRRTSHIVRIPVQAARYSVRDFNGFEQKIQMIPIPQQVLKLPDRQNSTTTYDLAFRVKNLPPMGFRSYYVSKITSIFDEVNCLQSTELGQEGLKVTFNETTGLVNKIIRNELEVPFDQKFYYYQGAAGNNALPEYRSSGAYIFRPSDSLPTLISQYATNICYKGPVVEEIHQTISPWLSQIIRIYKEECYIEFEWLVGPIPIEDDIGKEIITRYTTNLENGGIFYTDLNGKELLQRKKNFRPTWPFTTVEPVSGNYYPVTTRIVIKNKTEENEIAVLTDRAQGGSSLSDGQIELMIHRRLLYDDGYGVGEALDETRYKQGLVVRGKHYLMIGNNCCSSTMAVRERHLVQKLVMSPWLFFTAANEEYMTWKKMYKMQYSALKFCLPQNVQVLTLEPWGNSTLLIRLEHILEQKEDPSLSDEVKIPFKNLFADIEVISARKTTLAANQFSEDSNRLKWKYHKTNSSESLRKITKFNGLTLKPMEIATYILSVKKK